MNLNLTLLGQMISFAIFVWFCLKYVWPPIIDALEKRQKEITEGLADAQKGHEQLEKAQQERDEILNEARLQAREIIATAQKGALKQTEQAKEQAQEQASRILAQAEQDSHRVLESAKEELRVQVASLAIGAAQRILEREVNERDHAKILNDMRLKL